LGLTAQTIADPGWKILGLNPFGLYFYAERERVDELASEFGGEIIGVDGARGVRAEDKVWGMYEFAVSDPDGVLVRFGCVSANRS
jgi:hypothetical protein